MIGAFRGRLMINGKRFICVIPARGGSKGLQHKNLRNFCSVPLFLITVQFAKKLHGFDDIVVSSDDPQIIKLAIQNGVTAIERPAEISKDSSRTEAALIHVINEKRKEGQEYDCFALLEPTSPLRRLETVESALKRFVNSEKSSLVTVVRNDKFIGKIENFNFIPLLENEPRRRQARVAKYEEAGVVYCGYVDCLEETGEILSENCDAFEVQKVEATDINDQYDFSVAEILYREWINGKRDKNK